MNRWNGGVCVDMLMRVSLLQARLPDSRFPLDGRVVKMCTSAACLLLSCARCTCFRPHCSLANPGADGDTRAQV